MPKTKPSEQKNKKKFNFSFLKRLKKETEIEISVPVQLSQEELELIHDVISKIPILENLTKETYEEIHLLSLMKAIKKYSEKPNSSFDEKKVLNGMLKMYLEKKIDWNQYKPIEDQSNKKAIDESFIASASFNSDQTIPKKPSLLLQELQAFQFNTTLKQKKTYSISPKNGSLELKDELKKKLETINLSRPENPVTSRFIKKDTIDADLAEKLAQRKAISEGETTIELMNNLTQDENPTRAAIELNQDEYSERISNNDNVVFYEYLPTIPEEDNECDSYVPDETDVDSKIDIRNSKFSSLVAEGNRNSEWSLENFKILEQKFELEDKLQKLELAMKELEANYIDKQTQLDKSNSIFFKRPVYSDTPTIVAEMIKLKM